MLEESGTTIFLDRLTFPVIVGPPPPCSSILVQEHSSPLVTPKEINGRLVWFLRRRIEVANGSVVIRVYAQEGKTLGSSKVRFSDFQGRHVAKFALRQAENSDRILSVAENVKLDFHLEFLSKRTAAQTTKKVYIIRHAESRWNEAQGHNWWDKALSEIDHGVSSTGVEQSMKLRETLATVVPGNSLIALVSPHRRTLQTALIATRTLRIHLDPRIREFTAGPDGHANTVGEQICERAKEELRKLGVQRLSNAIIDLSAVQEAWWSHRFESTKKVDSRIKDFLSDLQFLPEERIIIVGHSRWFKRMFNITYAGVKGHRKSIVRPCDVGRQVSSSSKAEPTASASKGKMLSPRINTKPNETVLDLMNMDTDLLGIRSPTRSPESLPPSTEPRISPNPARGAPNPARESPNPARGVPNNLLNVDLLNLDAPPPTSSNLSEQSGPDEDDDEEYDGPAGDDIEDSDSETPEASTGEVTRGAPTEVDPKLERQREIGRALRHCKLPNCGCVGMDFVWDGTMLPQIIDAEIIHGEIEASESNGRKGKTDKDNCVIL